MQNTNNIRPYEWFFLKCERWWLNSLSGQFECYLYHLVRLDNQLDLAVIQPECIFDCYVFFFKWSELYYFMCHLYKAAFPLNLKTVYTIGNCQRPVFSQHMHKISNLWKFELDRSSEWQDNYERKKTPLSHEVVCVKMVDFETSTSKLEVSKSNSWKITPFSKTRLLQRELFLTKFYTINLSPLLVTK